MYRKRVPTVVISGRHADRFLHFPPFCLFLMFSSEHALLVKLQKSSEVLFFFRSAPVPPGESSEYESLAYRGPCPLALAAVVFSPSELLPCTLCTKAPHSSLVLAVCSFPPPPRPSVRPSPPLGLFWRIPCYMSAGWVSVLTERTVHGSSL